MSVASTVAHFVYPRSSNNHRAKLLHSPILALLVVKLLLLQLFLHHMPTFKPQVLGYAANIPPEQVIELTNQKRAAQGLNTLTVNPQLTAAAAAKGAYMLEHDFWAHTAPDGTEPWKFFVDAGYKYKYAGENLARDFADPSSAIDAWMASPTHRDNLLSSKYNEIGIAVVEGDLAGEDTTIIVQLFGTQLGDTVTVPVASAKNETLALATQPEPTVVPTLPPTPIPTAVASAQPVETVASVTDEPQVLVSPFNITRNVSVGLISILLVVIAVDLIVIARKKITRKSGRSLAHLAFFGMVLAILIIARAGQIL